MALTTEDLQAISNLLQPLKDDVQSLKDDVHTLKDDVQSLKGDVQTLKGNVHTLQGDVQSLKDEQINMKIDLESQIKQTECALKIKIQKECGLVLDEVERVHHILDKHKADAAMHTV